MDQLYHMNQALKYIEEHLDQEIDYKKVAQVAMTSEMYFKRLFSFLAGIPLSEYIRNRRMSRAAFDLQESQLKVIDIAMKYGYTSPDSFSRAFQQLHGLTPTEARQSESELKTYPVLSFRLTIEGGEALKYKLVKKEAFKIVGYRKKAIIDLEGNSEDIVSFLGELKEEDYKKLIPLSDDSFGKGPLFLLADYYEEDGKEVQDFYVAVPTKKSAPVDLESIVIPGHTWAVFTIEGDWDKVDDTWCRIYSEWFPSSGYEPAYAAEFMISQENYSEIWVAIKEEDKDSNR